MSCEQLAVFISNVVNIPEVFLNIFFFCITHHWIICKAKFFNLGVKFSIFWQCTHVVSMYHEDLWDAQLIFSLTEKVRRILFLYGVMRYFVPSKWNFNEISREIIILQEFKCDVRKSVIRFFLYHVKTSEKNPVARRCINAWVLLKYHYKMLCYNYFCNLGCSQKTKPTKSFLIASRKLHI